MAASVKREKRALRGERGKGAWGKEGKQSDIPGAGERFIMNEGGEAEGAEGRVQADEKGYKEAQAGSRSRPAGQMI